MPGKKYCKGDHDLIGARAIVDSEDLMAYGGKMRWYENDHTAPDSKYIRYGTLKVGAQILFM